MGIEYSKPSSPLKVFLLNIERHRTSNQTNNKTNTTTIAPTSMTTKTWSGGYGMPPKDWSIEIIHGNRLVLIGGDFSEEFSSSLPASDEPFSPFSTLLASSLHSSTHPTDRTITIERCSKQVVEFMKKKEMKDETVSNEIPER